MPRTLRVGAKHSTGEALPNSFQVPKTKPSYLAFMEATKPCLFSFFVPFWRHAGLPFQSAATGEAESSGQNVELKLTSTLGKAADKSACR